MAARGTIMLYMRTPMGRCGSLGRSVLNGFKKGLVTSSTKAPRRRPRS